MSNTSLLTNPVSLRRLTELSLPNQNDYALVLRDDIWKRGTLLLRRGKYLTLDIIDKLLKFGIFEVNVHLLNERYDEQEYAVVDEFKGNFSKSQNILIIQKSFKEISSIAKILKEMRFNENNIYASTDIRHIKRYFEKIPPAYLFIEAEFIMQIPENILVNLRNINDVHIFVFVSNENISAIQELEGKYAELAIKTIVKPTMTSHLKDLLYQCIDSDFIKILKNEEIRNSTEKQQTA